MTIWSSKRGPEKANPEKPVKTYDGGVEKFHRSLGAIQHAADKARTSPEYQPTSEFAPLSSSVRIQHGE
jgi:hypothetical protein